MPKLLDMVCEAGVFEVVEAEALRRFTEQGWELVEVLPEQVVTGTNEPITNPEVLKLMEERDCRRGYQPYYDENRQAIPPGTLRRQTTVARHRYLIKMGSDKALADANEAIARMSNQLTDLHSQLATAVHEHDETKAQLSRANKNLEELRASMRADREAAQRAQDKSRKLEQDLAAVRKAIGDLRYKEIVGG